MHIAGHTAATAGNVLFLVCLCTKFMKHRRLDWQWLEDHSSNSPGGSTLQWELGNVCCACYIMCLDIGDCQPGTHSHQFGHYRLHHRHRSTLRWRYQLDAVSRRILSFRLHWSQSRCYLFTKSSNISLKFQYTAVRDRVDFPTASSVTRFEGFQEWVSSFLTVHQHKKMLFSAMGVFRNARSWVLVLVLVRDAFFFLSLFASFPSPFRFLCIFLPSQPLMSYSWNPGKALI